MKKHAPLFIVTLFFLSLFVTGSYGEDFKDTNIYPIENEIDFSILMYDYQNSLILSLLGVKEKLPNQAGQIDSILKENFNEGIDALLKASFIKGRMNLLKVKKDVIQELKQMNVHLLKKVPPLEELEKAMKPYAICQENVFKQIQEEEFFSMTDSVIDFFMFHPELDTSLFEEDIPLPLINVAEEIALTRFDNLKWHEKIKECALQTEENSEEHLIQLVKSCSSDYYQVVSKETAAIIHQLKPHALFLLNLKTIPEKSEMEKKQSDSGKTYIWKEK